MLGGKIMDTFMEKVAGKLGAADMIKANSEAEAKQLEAYKAKVEELEKAVSDMRRLSLKCVETNEATGQLVQAAIEKIEETRVSGNGFSEEDLKTLEDKLSDLKNSVDKSLQDAKEENHKESVRVYRNVQAALIEELKQQSEALAMQHMHIERRIRGIKPCAIIGIVFSGINLAIFIALIVMKVMGIAF